MVQVDLRNFIPVHAADLRVGEGGSAIVTDLGGHDLHLLRMEDEDLNGARVHATIVCRVTGDSDSAIHINHFGGKIICVVGQDGTVHENLMGENLTVSRADPDWLTIDVTYPSGTRFFALGISKVHPIRHAYPGGGASACEIKSVSLEALPFAGKGVRDRIVYVDVGARHGLPAPWVWAGSKIRPIMFEPEPKSAESLRKYIEKFPGGQIMEVGLFNRTGQRLLYVTKEPGCSSLLPPNPEIVSHCTYPQIFDIETAETIDVSTYLDLFNDGQVPRPDVIKIDVQGCEYQVLEGFGDLLSDCIGIELETHISPLYHGQKLVTDLVALLDRFDFDLIELTRAGSYDRIVEFDARFLKTAGWIARQSSSVQTKYATLRDVWEIG